MAGLSFVPGGFDGAGGGAGGSGKPPMARSFSSGQLPGLGTAGVGCVSSLLLARKDASATVVTGDLERVVVSRTASEKMLVESTLKIDTVECGKVTQTPLSTGGLAGRHRRHTGDLRVSRSGRERRSEVMVESKFSPMALEISPVRVRPDSKLSVSGVAADIAFVSSVTVESDQMDVVTSEKLEKPVAVARMPKPKSLSGLGDIFRDLGLVVLIVEDDDVAYKMTGVNLFRAMGLDFNRAIKDVGLNGHFYRCVWDTDVEALLGSPEYKDKVGLIILDNNIKGTMGSNFGMSSSERLSQHFNYCPIVANSGTENKSNRVAAGTPPEIECLLKGKWPGVWESVEEKGQVVPVLQEKLEMMLAYFSDRFTTGSGK